MSNKNILIIIVIVVILILGILIWSLNWKIKQLSRPPATSQPAVPTTINTSTEPIKIQFKPTSTQTTSSELLVTSTPRVFCDFFKIEGCVKNKSQIDIDREKEGKEIIKKTKYVYESFRKDLSDVDLLVSDRRYQMFRFKGDEALGPTVVADLFKKEITDSFWEQYRVEVYPDRIVFMVENKKSEVLAQYKFGTEKHTVIPDSEIESPLTYCSYEARYAMCDINVITSTANTITLGVYDRRKIIRDDEDFGAGYKQVGTKTIKLPD